MDQIGVTGYGRVGLGTGIVWSLQNRPVNLLRPRGTWIKNPGHERGRDTDENVTCFILYKSSMIFPGDREFEL